VGETAFISNVRAAFIQAVAFARESVSLEPAPDPRCCPWKVDEVHSDSEVSEMTRMLAGPVMLVLCSATLLVADRSTASNGSDKGALAEIPGGSLRLSR
jgi:hypothetical protein